MSTPQDCKSTVCADNAPTPQAAEPVAKVVSFVAGHGGRFLAIEPLTDPPVRVGTKLYAAPPQPAAAPEDAAGQGALPCPFCGEPDPVVHEIEPHTHFLELDGVPVAPDHHGSCVVECGCGAGLIDETREAVLGRWNSRAALAGQQAGRDARSDDAVGAPPVAPQGEKIAFMDGIDWQHHVGHDDSGVKVFASIEGVLTAHACSGSECGVVMVAMREIHWPLAQQLDARGIDSPEGVETEGLNGEAARARPEGTRPDQGSAPEVPAPRGEAC